MGSSYLKSTQGGIDFGALKGFNNLKIDGISSFSSGKMLRFVGYVVVVVVLTLTRIIKSVVTGQAPVTLGVPGGHRFLHRIALSSACLLKKKNSFLGEKMRARTRATIEVYLFLSEMVSE